MTRHRPCAMDEFGIVTNQHGWVAEVPAEKDTRLQVALDFLRAILRYRPKEITYDEFAYKRLVGSYRKAARTGLELSEGTRRRRTMKQRATAGGKEK